MRTRDLAATVFGLAVACVAGVQACSSALPAPRPSTGALPPPGVSTPLGSPLLEERLPPGLEPDAVLPAAQLDVWNFTPLLGLPEMKRAADAYAAADYVASANLVAAHMAGTALDADDEPRWQLLLGTLRERAGDLEGAIAAFEKASDSVWPLTDYAALELGRCLLSLSQLERAQAELAKVPESSAAYASARGLLAEVACRKGAVAECLTEAQRFASLPRRPVGWSTESFQIMEMLVNQLSTPRVHPSAVQNQVDALALVRKLMVDAPGSAERFDAAELERRLLDAMPAELRTEKQRLGPAERLARAESLAGSGRHEDAVAAAEALGKDLGPNANGPIACQARLLIAKELAELKQRPKASERFSEVLQRCKGEDVRAWAFYIGGRTAFQDGRYPESERLFAQLEKELPQHRLADDARLYRAQAEREMGVEARFTELLTSMLEDYPNGDMTLDGVFLLALSRMEKGDWSGASGVLDRALSLAAPGDAQRGTERSGRERYFAARAWIEMGEVERGLAQYEALVAECPLSYYMLHAYSRLAERAPARAERAVALAIERAETLPFTLEARPEFDSPGFLRALELFRQSDIDDARRELDQNELTRSTAPTSVLWAEAILYARTGSARHSHAVPRWQLNDWLEHWPAGAWRRAWELAFPRPHVDTVTVEAKRQGIGSELVYAIMREESAFDAGAVSPANAYGLMQIISPTARRYGKEAGLPYDRRALTTPLVSIALGSRVLSSYMGTFFPDNPLLVIPGYNAGPGRPKQWAKDWPSVDFDVWVELIPYRETRRYTKRVLASRAAYSFLYYRTPDQDPFRLPRRLSPSTEGG
jgi:soluble lytic murein transglycosylase